LTGSPEFTTRPELAGTFGMVASSSPYRRIQRTADPEMQGIQGDQTDGTSSRAWSIAEVGDGFVGMALGSRLRFMHARTVAAGHFGCHSAGADLSVNCSCAGLTQRHSLPALR
jgi:hypothetical protein